MLRRNSQGRVSTGDVGERGEEPKPRRQGSGKGGDGVQKPGHKASIRRAKREGSILSP